jgi:hypothetical protein
MLSTSGPPLPHSNNTTSTAKHLIRMKSPPKLSPYGVFTGQVRLLKPRSNELQTHISVLMKDHFTQLFQYHANLVAFESSPLLKPSRRKCILIGGLSDGLIPTPYTSDLEKECHTLGWSLVQPLISSSYLGFGNGSLSRDTEELGMLMNYLVCHHDAEQFALVGHSTGCQNSIHFLKYGDAEMIEKVKVCAFDYSYLYFTRMCLKY